MSPYTAWKSRHRDDADSPYAWMVGIRYDSVADIIAYCQTKADARLVRDALNALSAPGHRETSETETQA